jgi:AraC-like DNA-binding protein
MHSKATSALHDSGSEHAISTEPGFPRTAGLMTRLAYEHAQKSGIPARKLAQCVGLTPRVIQDWHTRLDVRDQVAFLDSVAVAVDDDSLGFHLAQHADVRSAGLLYYVMASSSRLIEVFERGARYTSLVNEGISQTCIDRRAVGLELRSASALRRTNRHEVQFWITTLLRLSRQLTGKRLVPERVRFAHVRGRHAAEISSYLSCDAEYGAPNDSILFAGCARDLPIVNADPHLNRLLIDFCEQAMRRQRKPAPTFESMVENAIATLLPHGEASVSAVASRLGVSERTLARKLAAEGVGFSMLRTRLRRELAQRYLKEPGLSISEIAWLLGFRDVGAFSHAYKRWTGRAPREARARSPGSSPHTRR